MKIWSSKQAAYNSIKSDLEPGEGVLTLKVCTGQYKTTIKEFDNSADALALYKSYREDRHGKYVIVYGLYPNDR